MFSYFSIYLFTFISFFIGNSFYNTDFEAQPRWSEWTTNNCYEGIEWRALPNGQLDGKARWKVEFRNNYSNKVWFSYEVSGSSSVSYTTNRIDLDSREATNAANQFDFLTDNPNRVYVLINKVCFSSSCNGSYYKCDR